MVRGPALAKPLPIFSSIWTARIPTAHRVFHVCCIVVDRRQSPNENITRRDLMIVMADDKELEFGSCCQVTSQATRKRRRRRRRRRFY